ncbi:tyrosine-type recombinase/integrase [Thermogemmatispora sp.]|jgi:integrase/recombinase XerD|uniref:tyrosine-type recombinase/integrase n=1 Tax=Thermogemmatispora sp. TaxID=1968838 RepID=UPI0035E42B5D
MEVPFSASLSTETVQVLTPRRPARRGTSSRITEQRALAQRAKQDRRKATGRKRDRREQATRPLERSARRRRGYTIEDLIEAYLQDQAGGNRSPKTIAWHRISLTLLRVFLQEQQGIRTIDAVEAADLSAWFVHLRTTPGKYGKQRTARTVQTYARSARAFFHWVQRQGILEDDLFKQVTFPKAGRPLVQIITEEEFERLLQACAPPGEIGPLAERAAVRNQSILWVLYDTGIRVSELISLCLERVDRRRGVITVLGKGSKEREVALGRNCQRYLYYYLDKHRPSEEELAEWGSAGENHVFLSETRLPLTKDGVEMLFKRLKQRSGITGKRVSPHVLRHTFAVNYLMNGGDIFSLQQILGHEDISTVRHYMHLTSAMVESQKRKYSPGDHLSKHLPGPRVTRRRGFRAMRKNHREHS